jgi:HEAT repeat protein
LIDPDSILNELENVGRPELIERLHKIYPTTDKETRIKFLTLLNRLRDNQHFDKVENYFISDEDAEVRIEAAKLLAFNYNCKKAIKPLIWVIENELDLDVQLTALRLLVALWHRDEFKDKIRDTLLEFLKSREPKLKMEVIQSIGILKIKSAAEELIALLHADKKLIKLRAIQAIGKLGSIKAVPFLIESLGSESYDVWYFAFNALQKILDDKLSDLLIEKLKHTMKKEEEDYETALLQKGIIRALGEIGKKEVMGLISDFLESNYYFLESEAKQALGKIDSEWKEKYRKLL